MENNHNKYIDTHCHLHFKDYDLDRDALVASCKQSGTLIISLGVDVETSAWEVEYAQKHDHVYAIIGVHPDSGVTKKPESVDEIKTKLEVLVQNKKVVGIGELGFDYFRLEDDSRGEVLRWQREIMDMQIGLAVKYDLPIMLHCRDSKRGSYDAIEDLLSTLEVYKEKYGDKLRGQAHFFSGDKTHLERYLDLDFYISFTGVVTFADAYDDLVRQVPLDRILTETDAPFVAPKPYRGRRNEPGYVVYIAQRIAELSQVSEADFCAAVIANAERLYGIETS